MATWQIILPVFDQVATHAVPATVEHSGPLISELGKVRADRGRVEAVPMRSHWEAVGLSPYVDLARGWNRQADVERNPLFYNGTLTAGAYRDWLRHWSVDFVVLPSDPLDGAAVAEAKIVAAGQPWLRPVWQDANWKLYRVSGAAPLADPPDVVEKAAPAELTVSMPAPGSVRLRIPWSPVLGIEGARDDRHGCLTADGDWTRLHAPVAGTYRIGGSYARIRGTHCEGTTTTAASASRRRLLKPTMTVEPSWPATPSGSGRWPARSQTTRPRMKTEAITSFCTTRRRVAPDRATTVGMMASSSRTTTAPVVDGGA